MGDLSRNFSSDELRCRCGCGGLVLDPLLLPSLQKLRDAAGVPCIVHDAYRCPAHNAAVGGVPRSEHEMGAAADVTLEGKSLQEMYDLAESVKDFRFGGIGVYDTPPRIHVDVRPHGRARWAVRGAGEQQEPVDVLVNASPLRFVHS